MKKADISFILIVVLVTIVIIFSQLKPWPITGMQVNPPTTVTFGENGLETYSTTEDAFIYDFLPSYNNGRYVELDASGSQANSKNRALVWFDISMAGIPTDATINSAILELTLKNWGGSSNLRDINVYRTLSSSTNNVRWKEGTAYWSTDADDGATWSHADYNNGIVPQDDWVDGGNIDFTTDYGGGANGIVASTAIDNSKIGTKIQWDVTSLVRGWVSGTYQNYGFAVFGDYPEYWAATFKSSEDVVTGDRPKLAITYTTTETTTTTFTSTLPTTTTTTLPITGTNGIRITEKVGITTNNYPVQIARPFIQGEIVNYPQAVVDGVAVQTQADVKQRYSDGSVKHAIISFLIPQLSAGGNVAVTFQDQLSGNNVPLTQAEMLGGVYDFDAVMELTNGATTKSASARTMLQSSDYELWTSGQIATTIILADHSTLRKYDIGFVDPYKPFRPIFHATFWPTINKVRVRYIGEVTNMEEMGDVIVDNIVLKNGYSSPAIAYTLPIAKSPLTMYGGSRWTKEYWIGGKPTDIAIDENLPYLIETKFLPNYDLTKVVSESVISSEYTTWQNSAKDLYDAGDWETRMPTTGGRPDIGPYPTWAARWLLSNDNRMREQAFGNADLSAAWPVHFREGDNSRFFDNANTISAIGKVLSLNARPGIFLYTYGDCYGFMDLSYPADQINWVTTRSCDNFGWFPDGAHQPDPFSAQYMLTGDYWYLEEMYFWTGWGAAHPNPGATCWYCRGPTSSTGGLNNLQPRADAWLFRMRTNTAFLAPDGTAEQSYFRTLVDDAIAIWEGSHGVTGTAFSDPLNPQYNNWYWGSTTGMQRYCNLGPCLTTSPLNWWDEGDASLVTTNAYDTTYLDLCKTCVLDALNLSQDPNIYCASTKDTCIINDAVAKEGTAPWTQDFVIFSLGRAKEMGFATDALLSWTGKFLIGQITDPGFNPYLSASYMMPTTRVSDGNWFDTWAGLKSAYSTSAQTSTTWPILAYPTNLEHNYPLIARTAASFLTNLQSGRATWNWLFANYQYDYMLDDNPKWAIMPRTTCTTPYEEDNPDIMEAYYTTDCNGCVSQFEITKYGWEWLNGNALVGQGGVSTAIYNWLNGISACPP